MYIQKSSVSALAPSTSSAENSMVSLRQLGLLPLWLTEKGQLIRFGWTDLREDFDRTVKILRMISRSVNSKAEVLRLQEDRRENKELSATIEGSGSGSQLELKLPCHYIPSGTTDSCFGRDHILQEMVSFLNSESQPQRKCLVLHGMGGVGKTKIALQYVFNRRNTYDAIFWIPADNALKLKQSFTEIHRRFGLGSKNESHDAVEALSKVRDWLAYTSKDMTQLLVFAD